MKLKLKILKDKILEFLKEKENRTSLGFPLVELANSLNITLQETKVLLNELHKEKKIRVQQGINDKLIKLK